MFDSAGIGGIGMPRRRIIRSRPAALLRTSTDWSTNLASPVKAANNAETQISPTRFEKEMSDFTPEDDLAVLSWANTRSR